jgi:hypothetical protein
MTAAQPQVADAHAQLASAIGTKISQQLWRTMPDIAKALGPQQLDKAKFVATVKFINTDEGLDVEVSYSSDIPVPKVRVKIGWLQDGSQMSLFADDPTPPQAQPAPQPQAPQAPQAPQQPQQQPAPPRVVSPQAELAGRSAVAGAQLSRPPDPSDGL